MKPQIVLTGSGPSSVLVSCAQNRRIQTFCIFSYAQRKACQLSWMMPQLMSQDPFRNQFNLPPPQLLYLAPPRGRPNAGVQILHRLRHAMLMMSLRMPSWANQRPMRMWQSRCCTFCSMNEVKHTCHHHELQFKRECPYFVLAMYGVLKVFFCEAVLCFLTDADFVCA